MVDMDGHWLDQGSWHDETPPMFTHSVTWQPSKDGERLIGRILLNKRLKDGSIADDTGALLGLKVVGGRMTGSGRLGAFITKVKRGSVADTVGHLRPGDQVLEWCGRELQGASFKEVYNIILESKTQPQIELLVSRAISHQLMVTVLGAKDIPVRDDGRPRNPYVQIYFLPDHSDKSKRRTKTVKKSVEPRWNQSFLYETLSKDLRRDLRTLELTLWDQAGTREEDRTFLGEPRLYNYRHNGRGFQSSFLSVPDQTRLSAIGTALDSPYRTLSELDRVQYLQNSVRPLQVPPTHLAQALSTHLASPTHLAEVLSTHLASPTHLAQASPTHLAQALSTHLASPTHLAQASPTHLAQALPTHLAQATPTHLDPPTHLDQASPTHLAQAPPTHLAQASPKHLAQAPPTHLAQALPTHLAQALPTHLAQTSSPNQALLTPLALPIHLVQAPPLRLSLPPHQALPIHLVQAPPLRLSLPPHQALPIHLVQAPPLRLSLPPHQALPIHLFQAPPLRLSLPPHQALPIHLVQAPTLHLVKAPLVPLTPHTLLVQVPPLHLSPPLHLAQPTHLAQAPLLHIAPLLNLAPPLHMVQPLRLAPPLNSALHHARLQSKRVCHQPQEERGKASGGPGYQAVCHH
ncbi:hypothetical protein NHX12_024213 [Muraenolepis orangiensis]|uniref:Uncharacterized protein n=1 Tax=Muraenolepis orangiensis TaxID=630683 RepID=A0A9Q0IQT8_9TELE|nr:hypothetical protein NHX12_024213 [Muraenolepis orangiensis]